MIRGYVYNDSRGLVVGFDANLIEEWRVNCTDVDGSYYAVNIHETGDGGYVSVNIVVHRDDHNNLIGSSIYVAKIKQKTSVIYEKEDVDKDGEVDLDDWMKVKGDYGVRYGENAYDWKVDVNLDWVVDVLDLVEVEGDSK